MGLEREILAEWYRNRRLLTDWREEANILCDGEQNHFISTFGAKFFFFAIYCIAQVRVTMLQSA